MNFVRTALLELGFEEKGRVFLHNKFEISIDLIALPLTVGEENITKVNEIRENDTLLKLLTPTDSVKDRLSAYYHWNDQQALEQALMVCKEQDIDIDNVREWSKREEMQDKFKNFEIRFNQLGIAIK